MIHRKALFVGVSLAAAGTVMLIGLGDTAAGDAITQALRLWPLAIVALGVGLLVRRTRFAVAGTLVAASLAGLVVGGAVVAAPNADSVCEDSDAAWQSTRAGTFVSPSTVSLSLACAELQVTTVDGSAWGGVKVAESLSPGMSWYSGPLQRQSSIGPGYGSMSTHKTYLSLDAGRITTSGPCELTGASRLSIPSGNLGAGIAGPHHRPAYSAAGLLSA